MALSKNISRIRSVSLSVNKALLLLPIIFIPFISHGESFTAKRAGQGFTGLTQDFTSSLSNPALMTKYDDDDDVFFSINLGAMAADQYEVISTTEDISDDINSLIADINAIPNQSFQTIGQVRAYNDDLYDQADDIVDEFLSINNKVVNARNGLNLQILIPNQYFSVGFFTNQYGRAAGSMNFDEDDEQILYDGIESGDLELDDLQSSVLGVGYSIAEAGIMAAYPVLQETSYDLSFGAKLKHQRIDLYYNNITMEDIDDDDFDGFDEQYITDESSANIDLGLYTSFGEQREWHASLVLNNLAGQSVTHADQNITFDLDPSAILGLSYQNSWVSVAAEFDLTDREYFASLEASKYAGLGVEFRLDEHVQFRLGYRADLNEVDDNIYTAGIGISPWDVLAIDIAAFTGDSETLGAALQLSVKI